MSSLQVLTESSNDTSRDATLDTMTRKLRAFDRSYLQTSRFFLTWILSPRHQETLWSVERSELFESSIFRIFEFYRVAKLASLLMIFRLASLRETRPTDVDDRSLRV